LKNPQKHRVFYEIDQAKDEVFSALKLDQRLKTIEETLDKADDK